MSKYTVSQPVWEINIRKHKDSPSKYSIRQDGVEINDLAVLGVSEYKVVLNDNWFTTLDNDGRENYRKDRTYKSYIDDISVNIRTNNSILGDGIFISLYSTKKPDKKLLKKMVAKASVEIDKNYGFLYRVAMDELYDVVDNYEQI